MSTKPTINLDDSKSELWQWDTGRYLSLPDTDAKEVHISRGGMRSARVVKIQEQKAVIPDGLLVFGGRLFVYVVQANATGEMTVYDKWFDIQRRPKPDDYIYTDDEVRQWEQLEERLSNIESNGVVMSHEKLLNRDSDDQHPISAITGLTTALNNNSSAASEAMRAAQAAGSAASAAQDTANTAVKNADKAQQAADDAASVAQKAQTTAGNAQTAANRAQSTADAANATAEGLDSRITAAENELSQKQPAGDYLTEETDPTVPTWAKQPQKPTYTAAEVGALPRDTKIPSKVSELENDEKYAKTSELPQIDATLKQSGQAADAAETGKRIEAISPDDSTIDGKPWSSKQIIDTLCPPLEETGNPVQCYPVAGYPLGVKAKWEPAQEGSGTPSPENIRPIKGRDSVTITRQEDNQVITLTLPETVYGGEVDAVRGEGQETWKLLTLDGTEKWYDNGIIESQKQRQWAVYKILEPYSGTLCISSHLAKVGDSPGYPFNSVRVSSSSVVFHVASDGPFATRDALKSYLAAQYAAGTPVQVCYKLAEPVPFTATGAQPLPALAGVNTVMTDADSVTVTGRENNPKYTPQWYQVADITLTEPVQRVSIDKDAEGNLIADYAPIIEIIRVEYAADSTQASKDGTPWIYPFPTVDANNGRFIRTIDNWKNLTRRESYLYTGKGECIWGQSGEATVSGTNETSTITGALVMLNNAVSDTEPYDHLSVGTNVKVLVYGVKP